MMVRHLRQTIDSPENRAKNLEFPYINCNFTYKYALIKNNLKQNYMLPSGSEWIIIALVILLLFGGKKIPELMKGLGKGVKSFKDGVNEAKEEIKEIKEDVDKVDVEKVEKRGDENK